MSLLARIINAVVMKKALRVQYEVDGITKPVLTEKSKRRNSAIYALLLVYIITIIGIAMYIL